MSEERITGKITKLVDPGGYGFISSEEKPYTKIFFHFSHLPANINFLDLKVNQPVSFICEKYIDREGKDKGWRAIKIELMNKELRGIPEASIEHLRSK